MYIKNNLLQIIGMLKLSVMQAFEAYYITSSIYYILIKPKWILPIYIRQNL